MMRRRQDGGEDENMEPVADYDMGTSPPALPGSLAQANPPAARNQHQAQHQLQPAAAPAAVAPRQPLSVDIPTRDSLPEHRIQVALPFFGE